MAHRLSTREIINPFILNGFAGKRIDCTVREDGTIEIEGLVLRFCDGPPLEAGTNVKVWLTDFFYCDSVEAIEAERQQQLRRQSEEQEASKSRLSRRRSEAEAFNATFNVPVRWTAGHKDLLSGLSESSWGDGYGSRTVEHILLLEQLTDRGLRRSPGDFLCTTRSGSNGKNWSEQPESTAVDGDGVRYVPKITCKACLRIARRWSAGNDPEQART